MKSLTLYLTILMVTIGTIEAQWGIEGWIDQQLTQWEWMIFGTGYGRDGEVREGNSQTFQLCDEDGETGLTWDELKDCEVGCSLS